MANYSFVVFYQTRKDSMYAIDRACYIITTENYLQ